MKMSLSCAQTFQEGRERRDNRAHLYPSLLLAVIERGNNGGTHLACYSDQTNPILTLITSWGSRIACLLETGRNEFLFFSYTGESEKGDPAAVFSV